MPFRKSRQLAPRDQVADEARVCFAAAAGCLAIGLIGWLVNWVGSFHTHLPAFAVVGAFYGIMGFARWWKWWRMKPGMALKQELGH